MTLRRTVMLLTVMLSLVLTGSLSAQIDKAEFYRQQSESDHQLPLKSDGSTIYDPPLPWPLLWGQQRTDELETSFDCYGTFGNLYANRPYYTAYWRSSSFVSPRGSQSNYLAFGGLCVGGIKNDSVGVSLGFTNSSYIRSEFAPTGLGDTSRVESLTPFAYISDFAMRAEFHDNFEWPRLWPGQPRPLGLLAALRSHVWREEGSNTAVIYDLVLTNNSPQLIKDCVVGVYLDPDICSDCVSNYGWSDDLMGSLRNEGIAYGIDNDGDPKSGEFVELSSSPRAIGVKFIHTSFVTNDTSLHWWANSNLTVDHLGPYLVDSSGAATGCQLDTGYFSPAPNDDVLYCMMASNEWDYDQVYASNPPPGWNQIDGGSSAASGWDTRLLLSIGSTDIPPDSSIRLVFSVFVGRNVHELATNLANLPTHPDLYKSNLNFDDLIRSAQVSDSLADLLLDPTLPPIGLHISHESADSVVLEWDPWVYPDVLGYDIYVEEIPDSVVPYPHIPPPWYTPTEFNDTVSVGRTRKVTLTNLDPLKMYAVRMVHRLAGSQSQLSATEYIAPRINLPPPEFSLDFLFVYDGDPVIIDWREPESVDIDHYNVYKFDNHDAALDRYRPFYDDGFWLDSLMAVDSFSVNPTYYYYHMPIYARVDSATTTLFDYYGMDGNVYMITAVDKSGRESEYSKEVSVNEIEPRQKDILVITDSYDWHNQLVQSDSIKKFYQNLLFGFDYDFYLLRDSQMVDQEWRTDWHDLTRYKLVIIDDHLRSIALNGEFEDSTRSMERFLSAGGRLAYFGSMSGIVGNFLGQPPAVLNLDGTLFDNFIAIDSIFTVGLRYFLDSLPNSDADTLFAFKTAEAAGLYMPSLSLDYKKEWYTSLVHSIWPDSSVPGVATFFPGPSAKVTHLFRSRYPTTSRQEGLPVGILTENNGVVTYAFGFHLWYMNPAEARQLIDYILFLPTDVEDEQESALPNRVELRQNYPNPFNPETAISFTLPEKSEVSLDIYNVLGRRVIRLIENPSLPAGTHKIVWDGRDQNGRSLASGVYFYRLSVGNESHSRKMILLK